MFETAIGFLVLAAIMTGVVVVWMRLKSRYGRRSGGSRMSGDETSAGGFGAVGERVVAVAADTVLTRARNGVDLPTGVEVGVSDRDYRAVREQLSGLESAVNDRLHARGVAAARVRLAVREVPEVRRGGAVVIAASTEKATLLLRPDAETALLAPPAPVEHRAWLIVNGTRQRIAERVTIGRLQDSGIRLASRHASGHHATIAWSANGWQITDHSSNGTWVQGARVGRGASVRLTDGAVVRFADLDSVFVVT